MAGQLHQAPGPHRGCVIVGADRIAANGDVANKIGTYTVAVLAKAHGIPFYVAAPISTIDLATAHGDQIPIEERAASEVTHCLGRRSRPTASTSTTPPSTSPPQSSSPPSSPSTASTAPLRTNHPTDGRCSKTRASGRLKIANE